jgi:hypothetical protein
MRPALKLRGPGSWLSPLNTLHAITEGRFQKSTQHFCVSRRDHALLFKLPAAAWRALSAANRPFIGGAPGSRSCCGWLRHQGGAHELHHRAAQSAAHSHDLVERFCFELHAFDQRVRTVRGSAQGASRITVLFPSRTEPPRASS